MGGASPLPQRVVIVACNLLAPAGVLFFGWDAAAAIFLIWLDTLIVSLQFGALAGVAWQRSMPPPPPGTHRGGWIAGLWLGALFAAPAILAPALALGIGLHDLMKPRFPEGPLAAVFSGPSLYLWAGTQAGLRVCQIVVRAVDTYRRPEATASFKASALDQITGLMLRTVVLLALAWLSSWFGRPGLLIFLLATSLFLIHADLHENWLRQLGYRLVRR